MLEEQEKEQKRRPGLIHFTNMGALEIVLEEKGGHRLVLFPCSEFHSQNTTVSH